VTYIGKGAQVVNLEIRFYTEDGTQEGIGSPVASADNRERRMSRTRTDLSRKLIFGDIPEG